MTARTHDAAAFTALLTVFLLAPPSSLTLSTAILAVLAALIGGVAPDIDQPTAPLWRNLPIGKYFGKAFGHAVGGHRFLSHSLLGLGIFTFVVHLVLGFFQPVMISVNIGIVTLAFAIGMASHLLMDTITKEGVPWLLPIPFKFGLPPLRAWRITTGSWLELGVLLPALLIFNCYFIFAHYDELSFLLKHTLTR